MPHKVIGVTIIVSRAVVIPASREEPLSPHTSQTGEDGLFHICLQLASNLYFWLKMFPSPRAMPDAPKCSSGGRYGGVTDRLTGDEGDDGVSGFMVSGDFPVFADLCNQVPLFHRHY